MKYIGVLCLQGAFQEHIDHLTKCCQDNDYQVEILTVRNPEELAKCDSLIIPGGESTSMSLIAERTGMYRYLYDFVRDPAKSVWGTCAGLIYLSEQLENEGKLLKTLEILKTKVRRNAFGRQQQSFIKICDFSEFISGCSDFPAFFIRAPVIEEIFDPNEVKVLYSLENGSVVAAVQGENLLVTSFHPELALNDLRFHNWFIRRFVLKCASV